MSTTLAHRPITLPRGLAMTANRAVHDGPAIRIEYRTSLGLETAVYIGDIQIEDYECGHLGFDGALTCDGTACADCLHECECGCC